MVNEKRIQDLLYVHSDFPNAMYYQFDGFHPVVHRHHKQYYIYRQTQLYLLKL
jgi:hypothetical protein